MCIFNSLSNTFNRTGKFKSHFSTVLLDMINQWLLFQHKMFEYQARLLWPLNVRFVESIFKAVFPHLTLLDNS